VNEHDAIARIKRLSHSINCADEIAEVIERLINERDEARRSYCYATGNGYEQRAINVAQSKGWDCFTTEVTMEERNAALDRIAQFDQENGLL
jgi:hypothetical protein